MTVLSLSNTLQGKKSSAAAGFLQMVGKLLVDQAKDQAAHLTIKDLCYNYNRSGFKKMESW